MYAALAPSVFTLLLLVARVGAADPVAPTGPETLDQLEARHLKGCFAMNPSGKRMACVTVVRDRAFVELRGVDRHRIYRSIQAGSKEATADATRTPAREVRELGRWLHRHGYLPTDVVQAGADGIVRIPGATCGLAISEDHRYVETTSTDKRRAWLETGGPGGRITLDSVSLERGGDRLIITLDHFTEDALDPGATVRTRQTKVLTRADLFARTECAPPPAGQPEPSEEAAPEPAPPAP